MVPGLYYFTGDNMIPRLGVPYHWDYLVTVTPPISISPDNIHETKKTIYRLMKH